MDDYMALGFLKYGDYFIYEGKRYRVGHLITNTNGYVACIDEDKKTRRFYIHLFVRKVEKE